MKLHLIKYGSDKFDLSKFNPVKSQPGAIKPDGGLWASPVNSEYGWKEWCEENEFHLDDLKESFTFWYESDNILVIDSKKDLSKIKWLEFYRRFIPDFLAMDYDAIYLTRKGEAATRLLMDENLYGWDCESVFIMNPEGIII